MPRKLTDEDGNEVEVPTDEELKELNEKAKKADESSEELEKLKKENEELSNMPNNKAFAKMRKTNAELKKALEEKGESIEIDEETGEVKNKPKMMTPEEVEKISQNATLKTILENHLNSVLSQIKEDKREDVKGVYNSLIAGKEIASVDEVNKYLDMAQNAVLPHNEVNPIIKVNEGGGTNDGAGGDGGTGDNFSETEKGKNLAAELGMTLEEPKKDDK